MMQLLSMILCQKSEKRLNCALRWMAELRAIWSLLAFGGSRLRHEQAGA